MLAVEVYESGCVFSVRGYRLLADAGQGKTYSLEPAQLPFFQLASTMRGALLLNPVLLRVTSTHQVIDTSAPGLMKL